MRPHVKGLQYSIDSIKMNAARHGSFIIAVISQFKFIYLPCFDEKFI